MDNNPFDPEMLNFSNVVNVEAMMLHFENCGPVLSVLNIKFDYARTLKFTEKTLENYNIYKKRNWPANAFQKEVLNSFESSFKLLLIMSKVLVKQVKFEDIDFLQLRDLMRIAVTGNEWTYDFLRIFSHNFVYIFMDNNYLKTGRLFFTLHHYCSESLIKDKEEIEKICSERKKLLNCELLHIELSFLERFIDNSSIMIMYDSVWTEEQQAREDLFQGFLKEIELKDRYEGVPDMIQNFTQADKFSKLMFSKLDEYSMLVEETESDATDAAKISIRLWRGCIYNLLSFYQKDHKNSVELAKKSMDIWNALLLEYFGESELQKYIDNQYEEVLKYYSKIVKTSGSNYEKVISDKCHSIMELSPNDPEAKRVIKEINVMRRDVILIYKKSLKFQLMRPEDYNEIIAQKTHYKIAEHYRSIILASMKNMQSNKASSRVHLIKYIQIVRKRIPGAEINDPNSDKNLCEYFELQVDQNDFVKRFRTDLIQEEL